MQARDGDAAVVDELRLQGPRLSVSRLADGRYDISDLIDKWSRPKDEPDTGTPRFSLNNIQLAGGKIVFDGRFGRGRIDSYRAYRFKWIGRPIGQDNEDVFRRLAGLNREELGTLKKGGVI